MVVKIMKLCVMQSLRASWLVLWPLSLAVLCLALPVQAEEEHDIPRVQSFVHLAQQSRASGAPLLVMFSSPSCEYCERLINEVLAPMTLVNEPLRVIVAKVEVESGEQLRDFDGQMISADSFAYDQKVNFYPTIALLDAQGKKLVPNIIGYQTPEFYAAYLEAAIDAGRELIRRQGRQL